MSPEVLLTILGMAAVTFAIRAGGLLLADRLPRTGFVSAWMRHLPGAVLAALVAPAIANGGPAELVATGVTLVAYLVTKNLFLAMIAGVLAVVAARMLLGA
jgi:uncharacterized membrane protein